MKKLVFCLIVLVFQVECHSMDKQEKILTFWFGKLEKPDQWDTDKQGKWFRKDPEFDQEIRDNFAEDIKMGSLGEYSQWKKTPRGYLALIILLDQFPRNIFRGDAQTYAFDKLALSLVLEGIEQGIDKQLFPIERQFFYTPLMHSEDIQRQNLALELFENLIEEAPDSLKEYFEMVHYYAKHHHGIVEEFGRFPHRNTILQREPTQEEIKYLEEGGFSY